MNFSRNSMVFRANAVPVVIGIFFMTFGVAIFGSFLQWSWYVSSYGVWAIWGGIALAIGLGMSGFDALLIERTAPLVTASGLNPQGDWSPLDVTIHVGAINPEVVRREAKEVAVDPKYLGRDAKGRPVPVQVIPLGGRNAYGIRVASGGLGFLIVRGNPIMNLGDVQRTEFHFTPRTFRTLHLSQIEEPIIDVLRRHKKFVHGKSPLYELGSYAKGFVEYLWANEDDIKAILNIPHSVNPIGVDDRVHYQGLYHQALSRIATLEHLDRKNLDALQSRADATSAQAKRTADIYGRREPEEPGWLAESRKPQEETR
jgi:hypothetical protein